MSASTINTRSPLAASVIPKLQVVVDLPSDAPPLTIPMLRAPSLAHRNSRWPGAKVDPNIGWNLEFNHQLDERTVLDFSTAFSYQSQPNVSSGVGALNVVGNYLNSANKLSLGFQWTKRIATFTSYSLNAIHYDSSMLGQFQDNIEQLIDEEIRYLLRPTVVALLEYRFGWVNYQHTSVNDSQSHYFLGGADIMRAPRLDCGLRAGAELRYQKTVSPGGDLYPYVGPP